MFGRYFVDVETQRESGVTLETEFFRDYKKAEEYYKDSKKKDGKGRYTYSVAIRNF